MSIMQPEEYHLLIENGTNHSRLSTVTTHQRVVVQRERQEKLFFLHKNKNCLECLKMQEYICILFTSLKIDFLSLGFSI